MKSMEMLINKCRLATGLESKLALQTDLFAIPIPLTNALHTHSNTILRARGPLILITNRPSTLKRRQRLSLELNKWIQALLIKIKCKVLLTLQVSVIAEMPRKLKITQHLFLKQAVTNSLSLPGRTEREMSLLRKLLNSLYINFPSKENPLLKSYMEINSQMSFAEKKNISDLLKEHQVQRKSLFLLTTRVYFSPALLLKRISKTLKWLLLKIDLSHILQTETQRLMLLFLTISELTTKAFTPNKLYVNLLAI